MPCFFFFVCSTSVAANNATNKKGGASLLVPLPPRASPVWVPLREEGGCVPLASAGLPVPFRWPIGVDLHEFTFGLYIGFSLPFLVSFPRAEGFIREITPYMGYCGRCVLIFMVSLFVLGFFFFSLGPRLGGIWIGSVFWLGGVGSVWRCDILWHAF